MTKVAGKELKPRHVTKFNIPCGFNGEVSEVAVFIGNPEPKHSPIYFQSKFIQDVRGGSIPPSVTESLEKLQNLAQENGVPFEELCSYALGSIASDEAAAEGSVSNEEAKVLTDDAAVQQSGDEAESAEGSVSNEEAKVPTEAAAVQQSGDEAETAEGSFSEETSYTKQ